MAKKGLQWGETPWDDLSREDLLREVQRMYAALNAMYSILRMSAGGETSGFWGPTGSGGRAIEMGRQIEEPLRERYGGESIYRSFFRYALDLLFEQHSGYRIGHGWAVCPVCGQMFGERSDGQQAAGTRCADHLSKDCPGVLRALEWSDLEKRP